MNTNISSLSPSRKWLILGISCASILLVSMDATIINVALPSIGADLQTSVSGLQWTIDAYTLVLASFLILSGSTADRVGRRLIFQVGLGLFILGSVLCSVAPSITWLIVFRAIQGLGGSMLNPVALSIVTNTITDPKERARAIGIWAAVVGISMAFGPLVGGALTTTAGWRSIFWINAPIGIVAIVLAAVFIPESKGEQKRSIDGLGQTLIIVFLATLIYGLIEAPTKGWNSALTMTMFAVAAASFIVLISYESRRREALLDLRFFRSVPFSASALSAICAFVSFGSFLFLNSLYLQTVRGLSPFSAGIALLPAALMIFVCAPLSGRLVARTGTRLPFLIAGLAMLASSIALMSVQEDSPFYLVEIGFVLFGIGFGFVNAPITNTAVSGMPRARAGSAAAIASTCRQFGVSLGVALAGTLIASSVHESRPRQILDASHIMWWLVFGCAAVIGFLGIVATSPWARQSTKGIEHLLDRPGENPGE